MTRALRIAGVLAPLALAVLLAAAFYDRYWRVRSCFNELGRCYEPETGLVLVEQAGPIWGGLALLAGAIALINALRLGSSGTGARDRR